MTVHPFRDFGLVGREIAAAASIADLPRADSKGAAFGESALLWGRHLAKIRGDARDPARHGLAAQLAAAAFRAQYAPDHRADAASFFANDLVDRDSTITIRPQRPNAVLGAVPVDNVQPWMESWTAKFGEDAGVAAPYRKGSTDTRLVNGSVTEEIRPMMMFASTPARTSATRSRPRSPASTSTRRPRTRAARWRRTPRRTTPASSAAWRASRATTWATCPACSAPRLAPARSARRTAASARGRALGPAEATAPRASARANEAASVGGGARVSVAGCCC